MGDARAISPSVMGALRVPLATTASEQRTGVLVGFLQQPDVPGDCLELLGVQGGEDGLGANQLRRQTSPTRARPSDTEPPDQGRRGL
jgi:hypothetical protein